jgi:hypothetical protein
MSAFDRLDQKKRDLEDVRAALECVRIDDLESAARLAEYPPVRARANAMLGIIAELEAYAETLEDAIAALEPAARAEAAREQAEEDARYMRSV